MLVATIRFRAAAPSDCLLSPLSDTHAFSHFQILSPLSFPLDLHRCTHAPHPRALQSRRPELPPPAPPRPQRGPAELLRGRRGRPHQPVPGPCLPRLRVTARPPPPPKAPGWTWDSRSSQEYLRRGRRTAPYLRLHTHTPSPPPPPWSLLPSPIYCRDCTSPTRSSLPPISASSFCGPPLTPPPAFAEVPHGAVPGRLPRGHPARRRCDPPPAAAAAAPPRTLPPSAARARSLA
jgi:hypothetical protein